MDIKEIRRSNLLALLELYRVRFPTQYGFGVAVGVPTSYLSQIKSGSRDMGEDVARKIERKLKLASGHMDRRNHNKESDSNEDHGIDISIPNINGDDNLLDRTVVSLEWLESRRFDVKNVKSVTVVGDVSQRILNNDVVVIHTKYGKIIDGKLYALSLGDDTRIKRIFKHTNGSVTLNTPSGSAPDELIAVDDLEKIHILGMIVKVSGDVE